LPVKLLNVDLSTVTALADLILGRATRNSMND
jgi:hypothetical protein